LIAQQSHFELYDTHTHLDFAEFDLCRATLIERCVRAGISRLLVPSIDRASWAKVAELQGQYSQISAAYGLHPLFVERHSLEDIRRLKKFVLARRSAVSAIGEIGLDASAPNMALQCQLFEGQLELAQYLELPVLLHARKTHSQILSYLTKYSELSGVIHAFSGSAELLSQYVRKGFMVGVGCVITWASARKTRDAISRAPLTSLLLETDSPGMRVQGLSEGSVASPLDVLEIFSALCRIRKESPEELAKALKSNADRMLFEV
jgi:TatD DNase family protein